MKTNSHRFLCALCALTVFISALFPASAFAAQAADTVAQTTLTTADAQEMQQADSAVTALTGSDAYAEMTRAQRLDAAVAQLQQLAEEGLVSARSLHVDKENGMVSFAYSCGALGGVLVEDPDEENTPFAPSELPAVDLHEMSNAPQGDLGSAMIYYAFDNTVNSSRYPYYSYMKGFWTAMGLHTRIDTTVTVSDLKRMNDYGLCILSAHGSYYTYTSGFLFKQTRTEPVTLLFMPEDRVVFGVLTLLGAAMLITGLLQPLLQKIPAWAGLVVSLLLFAATYHTQDGFWQLGPWQMLLPGVWYANLFTAFFGFFPRGFFSTDYFPLLPWLFLFWAGYFLHFCMGRARMEPLRRSVCPALGWMGRHSLLLYLLHQPVIYGVLSAAAVLFA